ncbi:MAG: glycosyl hydrolase 53 family protein [Succinivibrio sp.]|nr:glycosyl hydrolase 53 family protein [Succinivibrio sp.]MDY5189063.1 glycosyl hydrolase 53 family protein [Succinivibrio sp.]MDY5324747.1 glycosyl hydrolase 53 family protein [Succinivibrio sp.]
MNQKLSYKFRPLLLAGALSALFFTGSAIASVNTNDTPIYVKPVSNLPQDFILGMDVSSYVAQKNSGVKYYDFKGNELDDLGFFKQLKDCGTTHIRIRVFNDPKNAKGEYYGGGNNDIETAKKIAKLATDAGLKVLIDFHYSDFWADPKKQRAPKAWEGMSADQKAKACYKFTYDSLKSLFAIGAKVDMVQIGNESNHGLAGEKDWANRAKIHQAGSKAIRQIAKEQKHNIQVAVHFANPEMIWADELNKYKVDYDIFASSYYPYWHKLSDVKSVLKQVKEKYGKQVMVVETSYVNTLEDGDGHPNTESAFKKDDKMEYPVTPQGQANAIREVVQNVWEIDGIGVFYWEPAWIPVQELPKKNKEAVIAANKKIWEKYGSGWATKASAEYDPEAGEYHGGSAVDNEALFDFSGHPLPSLNIYKYLHTGHDAPISVEKVMAREFVIEQGKKLNLPSKAAVRYTNADIKRFPVIWDEKDVSEVNSGKLGIFIVRGVVKADDGKNYMAQCTVTVLSHNYLQNPGFEAKEGWEIQDKNNSVGIIPESNNLRSGSNCLKFWDDEPLHFIVSQKVKLDKGVYVAGGYLQGGDAGDSSKFVVGVKVGSKLYEANTNVTKWKEWKQPEVSDIVIDKDGTEVEFFITVDAQKGTWGAFDDMYIYKK